MNRLAASVFVAVCQSTVLLIGAERNGRLDALLVAGEKNTPAAVEAAKQAYEQLKRNSPVDVRVDYAYALVLINQGRYRQANGLIDKYLQAKPSDLAALRVMLHAQILDRQYASAIRSAEALASQIQRSTDTVPPDDLNAAAEFLGTMFGYLELRAAAAMSPEQVSAGKNRVLLSLHDATLNAFDEGRQDALSLYHRVEAEREAKLAKEHAEEVAQRQQAQATLVGNRDNSGENRQTAQQSDENLRESQREYDVVARQLISLAGDRTQIGIQITAAQTQIVGITQSMNQQLLTPNTRLGNRAGVGFAERAQVNALSISLASLDRQALELDRRILALQTRAGELVAAGAKASEELAESTAALAKSEKRAKNLEKQLARAERKAATKAAAAKAPAVTGRMAQFSTYAPFPYEQEKERVLSWYAK